MNTRKNKQEGGAVITTGSKSQVWHGTAKHTSGGLTKKDLIVFIPSEWKVKLSNKE